MNGKNKSGREKESENTIYKMRTGKEDARKTRIKLFWFI